MKSYLSSLFLLPTLAVVITTTACQSQPVSIQFDNETLIFPITIKEAVERYNLSFNAPGYYYRREKAREISINIVFNGSDYHNEHQPKEVLYNRDVISYVFKYKGEMIQSDSIKLKVERLCKCKLTFITDSLSVERDPGYQPSIAHLMPEKGRHYYGLASLSKDVTVGFRNKPNDTKEVIPEVRFFYKQSADQIRRGMMQY